MPILVGIDTGLSEFPPRTGTYNLNLIFKERKANKASQYHMSIAPVFLCMTNYFKNTYLLCMKILKLNNCLPVVKAFML